MIKLTADMHSPAQENFLGLGAVYHGHAGQPDSAGRVYTEEQCILEAKRAADMRLKIARSFYTWYAYDFERGVWDWENERCQAFYRWLQRMKDANISVALNTGYSNVGELQGDHWQGPCPYKVEGDWDATVQNYAKWVSETYYQLVVKRGFTNVKYFLLFTEPNERSYPTLPYEGADYRYLWYQCARAAHEQLVKDGYRDGIKLIGPQEGINYHQWMTEWAFHEMDCADFLDGGSCHSYCENVIEDEEFYHSGNFAIVMARDDATIQQEVVLKKNTDYTLSVWVRDNFATEVTEDSSVIMGVCNKRSFYRYFRDYSFASDALYKREIKAAELSKEWKRFELKFNSGDEESLQVGIWSNIKRADGVKNAYWLDPIKTKIFKEGAAIIIDDCSLREDATGRELLKDTSFETVNYWYALQSRTIGNDYYTRWCTYEKDAIRALPDKMKTEYWHDEYNCHNPEIHRDHKLHGVYLAVGAVAMMNCGQKTSLMWTLFDQQWPNDHNDNHKCAGDGFYDGDHRHGLMPNLRRTDIPAKVPYHSYYYWGLISRYTGGEGTKTYEGRNLSGGKVQMNVNELPDGNYTITVVNYGDTAEDISIRLNTCFERTFYRHMADSAKIVPDETATLPGIDKVYENVFDTIEDTMPPMSVAVYTTLDD
ncbi:MAG: hypothetical protein IJ426_05010 [Clostridia bacterium]|nr:hypothetical protein [Clostridia bacterium]